MVALTELEHDALVEIFNIGVGQAAAAMSGIVNEEVTMSVPSISFLSRSEAAQLLEAAHRNDTRNDTRTGGGAGNGERICGVSQHYDGAFSTEALLMFPENKSLEIVRLMVGEAVPLAELSGMEQEAMSEIGNIILNSCVGTLANIFQQELHGSLPVYHVGSSDEILDATGTRADTVVMMLHIDFILEKHQIHGYVAFILDVTALTDLKEQIDRYLQRTMGLPMGPQ
ncbi:chemotaxis protein CheC [Pseudoduganella umbonata]|uniref:Chemotaxis protein CheC n=1 Tax=Pseudoduganella umbonata TaxID=864828 RepID=A0A4P8HS55_9BURK|nr:chemotaxis protein CheC [Pseudoduganella umbonata]MBB3224253.1 chemotaxis protein CheC [Pseudoduganella umbonata]QCP11364.1 chemotaxis protein CheC [Pseudoduganella umbonata]